MYYPRKRGYPRRGFKKFRRGRPRKNRSRITTTTARTWVVPDRMRVKLNYQQRITLSPAAGSLANNVFRLNSLYDPDQTGTGAQPVGFDQLSALYQKYKVYGAKVRAKAVSQGTTNPTSMFDFALVPLLEAPTWSNFEDATGNPYRKWTMSGNSNVRPASLTAYWSIARLFGERLADDDYSAGIAASPTNTALLYVVAQPVDRASSMTIVVDISITFYCEMFQRQSLALS